MTAREFILSRFKTKTAGKQGGVSSKQIFGAKGKARDALTVTAIEAELTAMRRDGVIAYTQGLWWRRNA